MLRVTDYFFATDTGRARPVNEDAVFARPPLFAVADGMGGAQAGEVASNAAMELFEQGLPDGAESSEQRLAALVAQANRRVHDLSRKDSDRAGMGTTLTAAYLGERELAIAHVGDSRMYRLRDGLLTQRTDDHSLVGELVRRGELSPEEAEDHPQRSIITRALGPDDDVIVDRQTLDARSGDVYLICSDGLTSMISDAQIADAMSRSGSLEAAGRDLIGQANDAGGRDNISVVLFEVGEVGAEPARRLAAEPADAEPAEAELQAEVPARVPRPPRGADQDGRPRGRGRAKGVLKGLAIVGIIVFILGSASWIATRSVYFVGTSDEGFVTLYQGMPYDLPGSAALYSKQYESGVNVDSLPPNARATVLAHKLRSHDDATDLVRQLEEGRVAGQR